MYKNKLVKISVISFASLGLALSVFAQTPSPTSRSEIKDARRENKEEAKQILEQKREELKQNSENKREELKQNREELKQDFEQKREELKDRLEQKKEELKDRIENKREELKKRLEKIKDNRKKQVVEKIDKNLDSLNEKITDRLLENLKKLEDILVRIGERTDVAEGRGVDVSSVDSAVVAAQAAIGDVKTAVEVQATKTYSLAISTEDKLKTDVGKTRRLLQEDLKVVSEKVKVARNAVHEAAQAFAKAHGRDLPEISPTISVSPAPSPSVTTNP
ncbi:MAG: hypothetical protein HYT62_01930 [Candidatus Yanofskybacteria bacterium]|nr:hypothetical protein [Candidatus Yanofskybacteria bacterium]